MENQADDIHHALLASIATLKELSQVAICEGGKVVVRDGNPTATEGSGQATCRPGDGVAVNACQLEAKH